MKTQVVLCPGFVNVRLHRAYESEKASISVTAQLLQVVSSLCFEFSMNLFFAHICFIWSLHLKERRWRSQWDYDQTRPFRSIRVSTVSTTKGTEESDFQVNSCIACRWVSFTTWRQPPWGRLLLQPPGSSHSRADCSFLSPWIAGCGGACSRVSPRVLCSSMGWSCNRHRCTWSSSCGMQFHPP